MGGRTLVVSSAYWSIDFFQNHNRYALLIFLRGRQDRIRKFSILMYTSRLLPTGVHDFWRKSMYVRASDFRRTAAISRQKRPKPLVQALQNNGARVDRYARIENIILTGLRYSEVAFIEPLTHIMVIFLRHNIC